MTALAGAIADPAAYRRDTKKMVAWGKRETNTSTSASTTLVQVLRLDGVPVKSGRSYQIFTNSIAMDSSVANDIVRVEVRYTTDGSTATTSSTMLPAGWLRDACVNATSGPIKPLITVYFPSADQTLSLLLCFCRDQGTGNVFLPGDAQYPLALYVEDLGPDTGNVGIVL